MNLKTNLANPKNYGGKRSTGNIKFLVIHYTANDGDTDENNGKYFKNNVTGTSAHYFVDDDSVTQVVPDDRIAWHCGAKTYKHATCRNANSIGIELCDDVKDGKIYPSAQTIANAIELTEYLMNKYNIPQSNVIRHYDVTGKACPAYWCGSSAKDGLWRSAFWGRLNVLGVPTKITVNTGGVTKVNVELIMLKNGSKGNSVKALQILLNGLGYTCGTADGIFGTKTVNAVKKFQTAKKLGVDGIVGAKTWEALLG